MPIVKPSGLSSLIRSLPRDASVRAERAADLIPGLERQFQPSALHEAFRRPEQLAVYRPETFERLAFPITGDGAVDTGRLPTDIRHRERARIMNLRDILRSGGFSDLPHLRLTEFVERDQPRLWPIPEVRGHEGRHRSRAMMHERMPASLMRVNQESMPEWMRFQQLGDLIQPEGLHLGRGPRVASETFITTPFKRGGRVRMQDGGAARHWPAPHQRRAGIDLTGTGLRAPAPKKYAADAVWPWAETMIGDRPEGGSGLKHRRMGVDFGEFWSPTTPDVNELIAHERRKRDALMETLLDKDTLINAGLAAASLGVPYAAGLRMISQMPKYAEFGKQLAAQPFTKLGREFMRAPSSAGPISFGIAGQTAAAAPLLYRTSE